MCATRRALLSYFYSLNKIRSRYGGKIGMGWGIIGDKEEQGRAHGIHASSPRGDERGRSSHFRCLFYQRSYGLYFYSYQDPRGLSLSLLLYFYR